MLGETIYTVATGAITVVTSYAKINGEGNVADTLSTINGGADGDILVLKMNSNGVITVNNAGNIDLDGANPMVLNTGSDRLMLQYDSGVSAWVEVHRSANS
jgi:hypothetical protein